MEGQNDLDLPAIYNFTPLTALTLASREKLSGFLDLEGVLVFANNEGIETDVMNDYGGLAKLAGFNNQDIWNMKQERSPTTELLDRWADQNGTVGNLWKYLYMMERYDVLSECRQFIVRDCSVYEGQGLAHEIYNREQESTERAEKYDAFICYTAEDENDRKFVCKMIDELEDKRGLRLFVPGRDDLPGSTITAYFIEERCKHVFILMSKTFLQSGVCDFLVKFAHAISPGARSNKFIPVIRERNTQDLVPKVLRFCKNCDFTKLEIVEWAWERLYMITVAPIADSPDSFDLNEYLNDIKFPAHRRLNEHN